MVEKLISTIQKYCVLLLSAGSMGIVSKILSILNGTSVMSMVLALVRVCRVSYNLNGLGAVLVCKKLLQTNEGGENEGQLAYDEGLEGEKSDGTEDQRDQSCSLQLKGEQKGEEELLLLLAA